MVRVPSLISDSSGSMHVHFKIISCYLISAAISSIKDGHLGGFMMAARIYPGDTNYFTRHTHNIFMVLYCSGMLTLIAEATIHQPKLFLRLRFNWAIASMFLLPF